MIERSEPGGGDQRLSQSINSPDMATQFHRLEELRAFVAAEIPSLDSRGPWTSEQAKAIERIYQDHLQGRPWFCACDCGHTVARFGEQCPSCLAGFGELGPVDWESIGA